MRLGGDITEIMRAVSSRCGTSEHNWSFLDHYLKLPIDLSRVLFKFVCTASTLNTIHSSPRQNGGSRS
ncbi:hypothetical protein BKA70DRAFT_1314331 [Coprinopsis sp. MPI-PUGE-AT-0042]|nr:hypothetical protein BKA70DRAFT_1314331 [Coprinopsis sp. MPI-PUGE-AT-0042]